MVDRIYIVGPVGSGKSTLTRRLARQYGFVCCELDSIVYEPICAVSQGNRKRPVEERDALLEAVLSQERWIVEDAGRACFEVALQKAQAILLLEPPLWLRRYRIVSRWCKQRLGLEACGYVPDVAMLRRMFVWTKDYEAETSGVKLRLASYRSKITLLRSKKEIQQYAEAHFAR